MSPDDTIPIPKWQVEQSATTKPPGYTDDVRAASESEDELSFFIKLSSWKELAKKYNRNAVTPHAVPDDWKIVEGPRMWGELHRRALSVGGADSTWLQNFGASIPCGECRAHWTAAVIENPPQWDGYFEWTVFMHNAVNVRLGKPIVTVEEARSLWTS